MTVPKLYQVAMEDLGLQEGKGSLDNPLVQRMYTATDYASDPTGTPDSVPWCGAAIAWWCKKAGIPYQRKGAALARNWLKDPNFIELKDPVIGAIGVQPRGTGNSGHVFIFAGWVDKKQGIFKMLGGNQSGGKASGHDGAVSLVHSNAATVLGWRWPKTIPLPAAEQKYRKSAVVQGGVLSGSAGAVVIAAEAPQLAEAIQKADSASSTGTILGAIAGVIIIAAAVWIIVSRINAARMERKHSG